MRTPEPLSPAARRLLELGTLVEPPTAEQSERMDRALLPLLGGSRTGALGDASGRGAGQGVENVGRVTSGLALGPLGRLRSLRRSLQHRLGANGAPVALALGTLAATAAGSFWLGRVSTPGGELSDPTGISQPSPAATAQPEPAAATAPPEALPELAPSGGVSEPAPSGGSREPALSSAAEPEAMDALRAPPTVPPAAADPARSGAEAAPPSALPAGESPSTGERAARADDAPSTGGRAARADGASSSRALVSAHQSGRAARDSSATSLALEIERIGRIEAALRRGEPARALAYLERTEARYLVEQAAALRAVARCQSGAPSSAVEAREVLRRWPASAFRARIRQACGL